MSSASTFLLPDVETQLVTDFKGWFQEQSPSELFFNLAYSESWISYVIGSIKGNIIVQVKMYSRGTEKVCPLLLLDHDSCGVCL